MKNMAAPYRTRTLFGFGATLQNFRWISHNYRLPCGQTGLNACEITIKKSQVCHHSWHRTYSSRRKRKPAVTQDPRASTRYPYIPGDPVQETALRNSTAEKISSTSVDQRTDYQSSEKDIKRANNTFKTDTGLVYEKILEGDIRLGRSLLAAKTGKSTVSPGTILLEGLRLIKDGLLLGAKAKALYFSDPDILQRLPKQLLRDVNLFKILYRDLKTWSDTISPSGILGIFQRPEVGELVSPPDRSLPITVILDSLKDPGNAGTLIRTAAAIGCERVIATKGTVNIWEGKVLRSSMAGHFCVPLYWDLAWSDVHNYLREDTQVFLADTRAGRTLSRAFDSQVKTEELQLTDDESSEDDLTDCDSDTEEPRRNNMHRERKRERNAYNFHKVPLNVYEYSDVNVLPLVSTGLESMDQPSASVALVLGGETDGLSAQAKKFTFDHYGHYVTIPMNSSMDSLNAGVAGSIIMYELRRKMLALNMK